MKKTIAPALAAGILALTLAGCSAGTAQDAGASADSTATASASASASPSASPSSSQAVTSGYQYKNPIRPAGEKEIELLLNWAGPDPDDGKSVVSGTKENPSGIDFSKMTQSQEYPEHVATELFTQAEIEKFALEGMALYLGIRTDPRLFSMERDFDIDAAILEAHRENFGVPAYEDWHRQESVSESYGYMNLPFLAGPEVWDEEAEETLTVDTSMLHGLSFSTPEMYGWVDEAGQRTLGLQFDETLATGLGDGRVATRTGIQNVSFTVEGGKPIIAGLFISDVSDFTIEDL